MRRVPDSAGEGGEEAVTVDQIARAAGVTPMTVLRVLRGSGRDPRVSDPVRERVLAAAADLGYEGGVAPHAPQIAQPREDTAVLLLQHSGIFADGSAFVAELTQALRIAASSYGFDLILNTKQRPTIEDEIAAIVDGRANCALMLREARDPVAAELVRRNFPAVYIFSHAAGKFISSVDTDNDLGGRLATRYLIDLGHRRIGHLGGDAWVPVAEERRQGYLAEMAEAGLPVKDEWMAVATSRSSDLGPFERMMRAQDRPTALFCWSDDIAALAMSMISDEFGLRIPEDVSVIGYDSTGLCELTSPRLTSIRQPFDAICDAAFDLLSLQLTGDLDTPRTIRFDPHLDERDSCRPLSDGK